MGKVVFLIELRDWEMDDGIRYAERAANTNAKGRPTVRRVWRREGWVGHWNLEYRLKED